MTTVEAYALEGGLVSLDVARLSAGCAPTHEQWEAELASGWPGPNGSSYSTDAIFGVSTGRPGRERSALPADVHDFWYRALRRLHATTSMDGAEVEVLRKRVDDAFYEALVALATQAPFGLQTLFQARCYARWLAVRRLGGLVNRPDLGEERFLAPACPL